MGFSELLDLNNSVTVHQKNLQVFVTEMYKGKNGIPPGKIFLNYNSGEKTKTVHYGLQSVKYLGPKLWELVLKSTKVSNSLSKFKKLIKSWKPQACPCRLCKT